MFPVGGIGAAGVGGAGRLDVTPSAVGEVLQMGGQAGCRRGRGGDDSEQFVVAAGVFDHHYAASISVWEKSLPMKSSGSSARFARA